ncbi:ATP-NAD kinase family protein [Aeromonas hydrophila]|uniref:ATP-NAD kinase family protein n=1 Tax=Aeromonas hydrophila TaxID=644 RepID=UPI001F4BD2DB|nr:ATP-NAD kinase family protein [Aeromonas hydrophila]MCO4200127.1 ATP-NAD kinase family protein [Aeromonas hydrophila]UNB56689.1 ATP-NAD kinase family protein [Aeromonas hydrophila]
MFRLGLIINPVAGIGGAVGLKGSDGMVAEALARGAVPKACERTRQALLPLCELADRFELLTVAGEMGAELAGELGLPCRIVHQPAAAATTAADTRIAAERMREAGVDLLLFAGGDGTARDICAAVGEACHVLGIPAGCKIHSGVYGVTPAASGRVAARMIAGELLSLVDAEVMDIDEEAFRAGKVRARHYGQLQVPGDLRYVQAVKQGGRESEELVLADIAAGVVEQMEPDTLYLMGSGSTVAACMTELGLENTLLGVDLVENGRLIGQDLSAAEILTRIRGRHCRLIITLIGGQGHLFGRGNQQLSPEVLRAVGRDQIQVLATKAKLAALVGRPLLVDTDDPALNRSLSGYLRITTGYKDQVIYPVANPE